MLGTSLTDPVTVSLGGTSAPGSTRLFNTWNWLKYALTNWGPHQFDNLVAQQSNVLGITRH